jgi:predicted nucleic acid-binding protein
VTPDEVPTGPLLIDTDVFSYILLKKRNWQDFAALVDGHVRVLSFATVGELSAAPEAARARWGDDKRARLEALIRAHIVLTSTEAVTRQYGLLHARFHGQFKDGGHNDMWVAACALAQPSPPPLVTNNLGDFQKMQAEFPALVLVHPDL